MCGPHVDHTWTKYYFSTKLVTLAACKPLFWHSQVSLCWAAHLIAVPTSPPLPLLQQHVLLVVKYRRASTGVFSRLQRHLPPAQLHFPPFPPTTSIVQLHNKAWKRRFSTSAALVHREWGMIEAFIQRGQGQPRCLVWRSFSAWNIRTVSQEGGKRGNHRESGLKHFEQRAELTRKLWRPNSRDCGLHCPFPSEFIWGLWLNNEVFPVLLGILSF